MDDIRQSVTLQTLAFHYRHDQRLNAADREALLRTIGLIAVDALTQDYETGEPTAPTEPRDDG